ncbi:MAG: hypothetical protein M3Q31_22235 [Actinomycetota bacterium]|nr:hypothetical protein [Actinomycetota bacterium]
MRRLIAILAPFALALTLAPVAAAASDSPAVVNVRTVPAVSGITLTFQGHSYVTDSAGRVQIPRDRGTAIKHMQAQISVATRQLDADTIVRFYRWFQAGTDSIAALDTIRRARWRFVDASGAKVPIARVERLVLRSTTGEVKVWYTRLGRPRWLLSRRVSLIRRRPVIKDVVYAVQRITVLGSDVVNDGQQRFLPEEQRVVPIRLAFFTLTVRGEDALFGSAVGTRARLELPDGSVRNLTLVHGQAVIPSLPRGSYRVMLSGGLYGITQPLLLSRSQVAVVPVVTYLDALAVGGGLLLLAIGLVLVGRPYLAKRAAAHIGRRGRPQAARAGRS